MNYCSIRAKSQKKSKTETGPQWDSEPPDEVAPEECPATNEDE